MARPSNVDYQPIDDPNQPSLADARLAAINQVVAPDPTTPPEHPAVTYARNLLAPMGPYGQSLTSDTDTTPAAPQPFYQIPQPSIFDQLGQAKTDLWNYANSPQSDPFAGIRSGLAKSNEQGKALAQARTEQFNAGDYGAAANTLLGQVGQVSPQPPNIGPGLERLGVDPQTARSWGQAGQIVGGLVGGGEGEAGPLAKAIAARTPKELASAWADLPEAARTNPAVIKQIQDARASATGSFRSGFETDEKTAAAMAAGGIEGARPTYVNKAFRNYSDDQLLGQVADLQRAADRSQAAYAAARDQLKSSPATNSAQVQDAGASARGNAMALNAARREAEARGILQAKGVTPDVLSPTAAGGVESARYRVEQVPNSSRFTIRDTSTGKPEPLNFSSPEAAQARADKWNTTTSANPFAVSQEASISGALSQLSTDAETAVRRTARELPAITAEDIITTPEVRQQLNDALRTAKLAPTDENASALADALLQQEKARPSLGNLAARETPAANASTAPAPRVASAANNTTTLVRSMREAGATEDEIAKFIGQKPPPPTSGEPPVPPVGGKDGIPPTLPPVTRAQMGSALYRNYIVSNALSPFTLAIKATSDVVKAADTTIEAVTQGVRSGRPAQIPGSVKALFGGFMRGVTQDAVTAFKNRQYAIGAAEGNKTHLINDMLAGQYGNAAKRFAQAGEVLSVGSPVPRLISALTSVFQRGYRDMSLYEDGYAQAAAKGLKGGAADQFAAQFMADPLAFDGGRGALERATNDANTRTWTNSNPLSRIPGRDKPVMGDAIFTMIPFVNLVTNLAREGLEFIPGVGLAAKGAEALAKRGGTNAVTPAEWTRVAQHQFMGTAGVYVLGQKASIGELTGDGPDNNNKRFDLIQQGWKPNHIKIGDRWYPNVQFGIVAPLLNAIGNTHDNLLYNTNPQDRDSVLSKAGSALNGVIKGELDTLHWLDGLMDLASALHGTDADKQNYVVRTLGLLVPQMGTLKAVERQSEAATPSIDSSLPLEEALRQRFFRQLPPALRPSDLQQMPAGSLPRADAGIASTLPFVGTPGTVSVYDGVGHAQGDPLFGKDTVLQEAARLGQGDPQWRGSGVIDSPSPNIGSGKDAIHLDPASARQYVQMIGEQRQKIVGALIASSKYQSATPGQQRKLFDQALSRADDFGRVQFLAKGVIDGTDPESVQAQAVAGFRAQNSSKDRAYWIALLDRAGKLTPEVTTAIDGLKEPLPGDKAPYTVAEYLRAAPIVHEFMSHVPYGTDANPVGTPQDWAAVARAHQQESVLADALVRKGIPQVVAKAQAKALTFRILVNDAQKTLFMTGALLENPERIVLTKRYGQLLTNFLPSAQYKQESQADYTQFPLSSSNP